MGSSGTHCYGSVRPCTRESFGKTRGPPAFVDGLPKDLEADVISYSAVISSCEFFHWQWVFWHDEKSRIQKLDVTVLACLDPKEIKQKQQLGHQQQSSWFWNLSINMGD